MGIPKFYRWLSERYPLVNQPVGVAAIPEFDNLYLDMNGIIHNCTHGNDPSTKLTEAEMVVRTFNYLDRLVQIAKPQQLLFMAIDGVAPRAKMNQQRARRFRSARDAEEAAAAAARKGEAPPPGEEAFDSNCITPGTAFMARLGDHLRFFIRHKMAGDPVWQRPRIVFSGHDVPGEGEHKIMEYIRWAKRDTARPWQPNQRHCLYGLDADLIMLSLVTHEPHFCLLREVVSYSGGARGRPAREVLENPCAEHFILFQVGLLRDYLELEFQQPAEVLGFKYDLERVIDDFVLFCMLIGNDFLPSLPTLDIAEGALDKIFAIYKELLPAMGGYLTEAGQLNRRRLQLLLDRLSQLEQETLELRAQDAEYFESKKSRRGGRGGGGGAGLGHNGASRARPAAQQRQQANELDPDGGAAVTDAEITALGGAASDLAMLAALEGLPSEPEPEGPTMMGRLARELLLSGQGAAGLQQFKEKYYAEKLEIKRGDDAGRRRVVDAFVEGLHWVLEYYYRGVASWTWYYPFHYAPITSDMTDIAATKVAFAPGAPFLPFEQLLAVLPAASCRLLPQPFEFLMKDPQSPILDFYPTDFRVDQEGKRNDWEGIVLVPFVDEQRLLTAAKSVPPARLTEAERTRNKLGDMLVFEYKDGSDEEYYCTSTLPNQFASVQQPNSRCMRVPPPPPLPDGTKGFVPAVFPGTKSGPESPAGFATLKTLQVSPDVRQAGVAVFGRPSGKESLILKVKGLRDALNGEEITADMVAPSTLGEKCWVRWPYLQEALVFAVSDRTAQLSRGDGGGVQSQRHAPAEADEWAFLNTKLTNDAVTQQGLEVGPTDVVLHVRPCEGLVRQLDGTVEKRFAKAELRVPLQVTLRRNPAPDPRMAAALAAGSSGGADLQPGARALFVGRAYYGCAATVLDPGSDGFTRKGEKLPAKAGGMLRVALAPAPMTAAQAAQTARRLLTTVRVQYQPSGAVARKLAIDPRTLGKITGNVEVIIGDEKVDVGLAVKNGRGPLCVPDFTKPAPSGTGWQYSQALAAILTQYKARFAWVFRLLEQHPEERSWDAELAFPEAAPEERLRQARAVREWLNKSPLGRRPLVKVTAEVAPEEAIRQLQTMMPPPPRAPLEPVLLENVSPGLLLPPAGRGLVAAALAGGSFELGDRVACLRGTGSPPLAARGTVVGIYDDDAVEVLFDEPFAEGTDLHGKARGRHGGMLPATQLLNLSKPQAVAATGAAAPRAVRKARPTAQDAGSSPAAALTAASAASAAAAQAALAAAAGRRQPPPAEHAAEAPHQNGVVQRQNGTAHGAAARQASGSELLQRRGSAGSTAAGALGGEAGSRPGSAPPSRTASPARLRPASAMSQPKGPQPKGPSAAQDRGFSLGRGRSLPPPPAGAGLSTSGVSPGMALLQSLRQSEAPPADALAAVQPPAAAKADSSASHDAPGKPPGGSGAAAGSSGAALLQQLQGLSIAQRPAPGAAEAAAAPPGEGLSAGSTSDVQLAPGLAALQQLQRAPPPLFTDAAAGSAPATTSAPKPAAAASSAALSGSAPEQAPEHAAAAAAPAAVSAAASVGLLRQLRGSSAEVDPSDLSAIGSGSAAAAAGPEQPAGSPQQAPPAASLPDGLSLLRDLQQSRPPAAVAPAAAAPPQQLPVPPLSGAAPAAAGPSAPAAAPGAPDLGSSFLKQLRQRDGAGPGPPAEPDAALPDLSSLTSAASALARRASAGPAGSPAASPVRQQATADGGGLLQMLQRGGGAAAAGSRDASAAVAALQQPQQPRPQLRPPGGGGGRAPRRPYMPLMQPPAAAPPPPPLQGGHWPAAPFPHPGMPPPPPQQFHGIPQHLPGSLHPGMHAQQYGFSPPQPFPPQPWPGQQYGQPPPPGWPGTQPLPPAYGIPPGAGGYPPSGFGPMGGYAMPPPPPQQHGQAPPFHHQRPHPPPQQQPAQPRAPPQQPPPLQQSMPQRPVSARQAAPPAPAPSASSPSSTAAAAAASSPGSGAALLSLLKPAGAVSPAKQRAVRPGSAFAAAGSTAGGGAPQQAAGGGGGLGNAGAHLLQQLRVGGGAAAEPPTPQPAGGKPVSEADFWQQLQQKGMGK